MTTRHEIFSTAKVAYAALILSSFVPARAEGAQDAMAALGLAAKEEAEDISRPKVVSVTAANGASAIESVTEFHIRFDRPMEPQAMKIDWESGGFLDCDFPKYDAAKYEFSIPVHLAPGLAQQIVLNKPMMSGDLPEARQEFPRDGFQSADHHLAGMFVWQFHTQARPAATSARAPHPIHISPSPGSETPMRTFLEIQFDQPMAPPSEAFPYVVSDDLEGKPLQVSLVQYDAARQTFRILLVLAKDKKVLFSLTGFRSAAGVPASAIPLHYQVSGRQFSQEDQRKMDADLQDPRLLAALEAMKQKRMQLTSLVEHIQDLSLVQKDGLFVELQSLSSIFKWQKPGQIYADAAEPMEMCSDFRIGSDGQQWWWRAESVGGTNFVLCPQGEMRDVNIAVNDPFHLSRLAPAEAAARFKLKYDGIAPSGPVDYLQLEAWPFGTLVQWSIDPATYRPAQITLFGFNNRHQRRFFYESVNKPLPAADFAVPRVPGTVPSPPEPLDAQYTSRFIHLSDGSDGSMTVQQGKQGPHGTSDQGFSGF
ncbi:MAG TPA: Ig-like domain-containing protein [Candidatus Saccharimonadales bacterium]|nr:Ig-like domain-containing protein [Candidatus Saccharimonadales bacterium]